MEQNRKMEMGKKRKDDIYVPIPGTRRGGGAAVKTPWSCTNQVTRHRKRTFNVCHK